jgi:hypothetical protein
MRTYLISFLCLLGAVLLTSSSIIAQAQSATYVSSSNEPTAMRGTVQIMAESGVLTQVNSKTAGIRNLPAQNAVSWSSDPELVITNISPTQVATVEANVAPSTNIFAKIYCTVTDLQTGEVFYDDYTFEIQASSLGKTATNNGWVTAFTANQTVNSLTLFPNPAQDYVQVQLLNQQGKVLDTNNALLRVLDLQGRVVWSGTNTTINTSQLATGVYIVQATTEENTVSKKLMVK